MKGISIAAVLGIIFIVLRLCKVIAWSWLWVLAPFWAPSAIAFVILIIASACNVSVSIRRLKRRNE